MWYVRKGKYVKGVGVLKERKQIYIIKGKSVFMKIRANKREKGKRFKRGTRKCKLIHKFKRMYKYGIIRENIEVLNVRI